MREIEYGEVRGSTPSVIAKGCWKGLFDEFAFLARKGVSLGLVLFLALGTLTLLNRSADLVEASLKERFKPGREIRRSLAVPRIYPAYVSSSFGPVGAAEARGSVRDTLRESTDFLDAVERFSRTLGRFAK